MKKLIFILLLVSTFQIRGWDDKTPSGLISGYYNDMFFDDQGEYGWAVGNAGKVMRTTNGGSNWVAVEVGVICDYKSVFFVNNLTGWIIGSRTPWSTYYDAYIIKTTDGGNTWVTQYTSTSNEALSDMYFTDELNGWVVGLTDPQTSNKGLILHTTNSGEDWIMLNFEPGRLYAVEFYDSNIGYVGGSTYGTGGGDLHKTTDGGFSWSTYTLPVTGDNEWVLDLDVVGVESVYCLNKDKIYFTNNGGISWVNVFSSNRFLNRITSNMNGSIFASSSYTSNIYKSQINSTSWDTLHTNPEVSSYNSIRFCNNGRSYALSSAGILLTSLDEGLTWDGEKITTHSFNTLFLNPQQLIVGVDGGKIWKSTDAGSSWIKKQIPTLSSGKLEFLSDLLGWIYTDKGLFKTTDGGENWVKVSALSFETLKALNSQILVATLLEVYYGVHGFFWTSRKIVRSEDGGVTWQTMLFTNYTYTRSPSMVFLDENNGWEFDIRTDVTNYTLNMFKTSDGGINWQWYGIASYNAIWAPNFVNNNIGFSIARDTNNDTAIVKTTDSGISWFNIFSANIPIQGLFFIDESNGWACGNSGITYRTTNGGISFDTVQTGINENLIAIKFLDHFNGFIVGQDGIVLRTTDGGVTFIEDGKKYLNLSNFALSQNYPNPFNPSTKISWQSPVGSWQTLKVYDILGNEVSKLVDEYRNSGSYYVEFDGSNLPSDVYFYRLQAGDFVETKKMILLK